MKRLFVLLAVLLPIREASAQSSGSKFDGITLISTVVYDECVDTSATGEHYTCNNTHSYTLRFRFFKGMIFVDVTKRSRSGDISTSNFQRETPVVKNTGDIYIIGKTIDVTKPEYRKYGKLHPDGKTNMSLLTANIVKDTVIITGEETIEFESDNVYVVANSYKEISISENSCSINKSYMKAIKSSMPTDSRRSSGSLSPQTKTLIEMRMRKADCHVE
jgi:hypothetical protein